MAKKKHQDGKEWQSNADHHMITWREREGEREKRKEGGREGGKRERSNHSIGYMETGRSVNRTWLQLYRTFEANLGYTNHCIRQRETKQKIS